MATSTLAFADACTTGWTIVTLSGEEIELCPHDSVNSEILSLANGGRSRSLALDSIGLLVHRPAVEPSAGSYIITLGAAVLAVGVFLNNVPEQPDLTMSSGLIYGLEFGGAMLLGAAVGYAVGYLIDRSAVDTEKVDLTGVSRLEKFEAIRSILLRTAA
jgi:hypothetical protein